MELDDSLTQLKTADEMLKTASADAARLAEELRQEQEHSQHIDRMRRALEAQIKEMQACYLKPLRQNRLKFIQKRNYLEDAKNYHESSRCD